ncbi:hypothetical protein N7457_008943 [Penicillium paradoxum]|uniref:uncharacterized protein n=1 Tax=Penicillium paradoxum TaxID=176176 RepID=UPI0025486C41|nr:uncharacterized protein N7457_008943 [Penicillium paradoxum]KAJ5774047.1 hypothetical protein N7457_008943 [Penicillium paradoxum]
MPLSDLPAELIDLVTEYIQEERYLNSLARTCQRLHLLLNPILYERAVRLSHAFPLVWAAQHDLEETARQASDAGASKYFCQYNLRRSLIAIARGGHENIARLILQQSNPRIIRQTRGCRECIEANPRDDSNHFTPLSLAAARGVVAILNIFFAYGIPDYQGDPGSLVLACVAAQNGHLAALKAIIDAGYSFNYRGGIQTETPLHAACRQGHTDVVRYLLDIGAEIASPKGASAPLVSAAEHGHFGIVKLLLERGADPDKDIWGSTALSYAAKNGHVEIVELLLNHGADLDSEMDRNRNVLYHIAQNGQLQVLNLLLARGADIYPKEVARKLPSLALLMTSGSRLLGRHKQKAFGDVFRTFIDLEDEIIDEDKTSKASFLYLAANYGWEDLVRRILARGFLAGVCDDSDRKCYNRAMTLAIESGHIGVVKLLLQHGAHLQKDITENAEENVLCVAIKMDNIPIAELLIDYGADINCNSSRGETALAEAALTSTEMFQFLLDRGADPTQASSLSHESAITRALSSGKVGMIEMLMDRGIELKMPRPHVIPTTPKPEATPYQKKQLIEEAFLGGDRMAELVLDRGVLKIDPESIQAQEGLSHAVLRKMPGVVKRLLERGVDPKTPLLKSEPPLLATAVFPSTDGHTEAATVILDLLLAHGADIEDRGYFAATPLYWALAHRDTSNKFDCRPAEIRLLLERGADPLAMRGDYPSVQGLRDGGESSTLAFPNGVHDHSIFMGRRSTSVLSSALHDDRRPHCDHDPDLHDHIMDMCMDSPHKLVLADDPFAVCIQRGDKSVLKLILEAIDQRGTPFADLKDRLDQAQAAATQNGHRHLIPILQDYYWVKRYPC